MCFHFWHYQIFLFFSSLFLFSSRITVSIVSRLITVGVMLRDNQPEKNSNLANLWKMENEFNVIRIVLNKPSFILRLDLLFNSILCVSIQYHYRRENSSIFFHSVSYSINYWEDKKVYFLYKNNSMPLLLISILWSTIYQWPKFFSPRNWCTPHRSLILIISYNLCTISIDWISYPISLIKFKVLFLTLTLVIIKNVFGNWIFPFALIHYWLADWIHFFFFSQYYNSIQIFPKKDSIVIFCQMCWNWN